MRNFKCSIMKLFSAGLTLCLCFGISLQLKNDTHTITNAEVNNKTTDNPNYYMNPQVRGFNSTKLVSGPIVLVNQRTLFLPDIRCRTKKCHIQIGVGNGSPNGDTNHLVYDNYLETSANWYVTLPESLPLNDVTFVSATVDKNVDYVLLDSINKSTIKKYDEADMEDNIFRIPKCCRINEYLNKSAQSHCSEVIGQQPDLDVNVFESNETGLDPDMTLNSSNYRLIPYHQYVVCGENEHVLQNDENDIYGLIYNSSIIIQATGILSHREYCVDNIMENDGIVNTTLLYCYYQLPMTRDPDFYFPVLILSAICFALSAVAYCIILKKKDLHKTCFIMFSISMCLAFICLVVMQSQSHNIGCKFLGFIFLFSVVLSFIWLLILCLELLYMVMVPIEDNRQSSRWYWYLGFSLGPSFLIIIISLFSGEKWTPDVPNSFIMNYGPDRCQFQITFGRTFIIFVPMILTILGSFISLILVATYMNKNEANKKIASHYDWTTHSNSYKFLSRTYFIIIIVASFWLINIFFYENQLENGKTQLALDVIKASLGVVTLIGFVGNKYTRNEIWKALKKEKHVVNETEVGLSQIPTPPESPIESEPFISHMDGNSTTFQNNRNVNNR